MIGVKTKEPCFPVCHSQKGICGTYNFTFSLNAAGNFS